MRLFPSLTEIDQKIRTLESELRILEENSSVRKAASSNERINQIQESLQAATDRKEELEETLQETKQKLTEISAEIDALSKRKTAKSDSRSLKRELDEAKKAEEELAKRLKRERNKKMHLESDIARGEKSIAKEQRDIDSARSRYESLLNAHVENDSGWEDIDQQLKELAEKLKTIREEQNRRETQQIPRVREQLVKLEKSIDRENSKLLQDEEKLVENAKTLAKVEAEREKFLASNNEIAEAKEYVRKKKLNPRDLDVETVSDNVARSHRKLMDLRYATARVHNFSNIFSRRKLHDTGNLEQLQALAEAADKNSRNVEQVLLNKSNVLKTLAMMDCTAAKLVRSTVLGVNANFGHILNELLPGSDAEVEIVSHDEKHPHSGINIRVKMAGSWKTHLKELSGGQQSLVAFAFLFALLKLRPCPYYVLDEIDAALDISHTKNIGGMIRKFFGKSQFIVISLKEGMFNNANVVYRVQFRDGTSQVSRLTGVDRFYEIDRVEEKKAMEKGHKKRAVVTESEVEEDEELFYEEEG